MWLKSRYETDWTVFVVSITTWLSVIWNVDFADNNEYVLNCCNQNPVHFPRMWHIELDFSSELYIPDCYRCEAGFAYPFGSPEITSVFGEVRVTQSGYLRCVLCTVVCLIVRLSFFLCHRNANFFTTCEFGRHFGIFCLFLNYRR